MEQNDHTNASKENNVDQEDPLLVGDSLTILQNSVDRLAVNIFDALRLLPGNDVDEEARDKIKSLAEAVNKQAKDISDQIDSLPGIDFTEEEQLAAMADLERQSQEHRKVLFRLHQEAETIADETKTSTSSLADQAFGITQNLEAEKANLEP